jgi:hypothetical protein
MLAVRSRRVQHICTMLRCKCALVQLLIRYAVQNTSSSYCCSKSCRAMMLSLRYTRVQLHISLVLKYLHKYHHCISVYLHIQEVFPQLHAKVQALADSGSPGDEIRFPSTASFGSKERRALHEMAAEAHLGHESTNDAGMLLCILDCCTSNCVLLTDAAALVMQMTVACVNSDLSPCGILCNISQVVARCPAHTVPVQRNAVTAAAWFACCTVN